MKRATLGQLELTILLAVARLGDDAYGLAIRRDLAARTGREHAVGAIYTTLARLEEKGLVASRMTDPQPVRGGRARRAFRLTSGGKRAMREARHLTANVWAGIGTPISPRTA
jgi:DNA-binding PadR family transcriptional regulator